MRDLLKPRFIVAFDEAFRLAFDCAARDASARCNRGGLAAATFAQLDFGVHELLYLTCCWFIEEFQRFRDLRPRTRFVCRACYSAAV